MAVISLPTNFSFTTITKFGLDRSTNTMRSKYTGQKQVIVYPYAVWVFEGTLVDYDGANASAIRSFLMQLEGQKNTFRLPVPGVTLPQTGYATNLTTNAAAVSRATSISVGGGTANAPYLKDGDFFTIQDELKVVVGNVTLSGTGTGTVVFMPPLRAAVASGVTVISVNPTCYMSALNDQVAVWGLAPPYRHSVKFSAVESF